MSNYQKDKTVSMKKINSNRKLEQKKQVHALIAQGLSNKDIAQRAGVTEKTVATWIDQYGWRHEREQALYGNSNANSAVDFVAWVQTAHADSYAMVDGLYKAYIKDITQ